MFKRLRWTIIGAAAGVGVYVWATRRAKETVREAVPQAGADALQTARDTARELGARMREAVGEARTVMSQREVELRRDLLPDDR